MRELQTSTCPDENELLLWIQGLLSPQERNQLEQHIDQCEECRRVVAQLIRVTAAPDAKSIQPSVTLIRIPAAPEPNGTQSPALGQLLVRGTNLGRYVILDCLGSGGTAVVYGAYDPELERKVAIKLLRKDLPGLGSPEANRSQLLHEAQAMARLSHPNVIVVYDVGTFRDQVFLAMEFIRGTDLRGWLAERSRSWREILEVFLRAGDGLVAAHRSGLVHRDFKPDNVLVGNDGQVRVTDFGLARAIGPPEADGVRPSSTAAAHVVQFH